MAAQGDSIFDYEGTITLDSERGRKWFKTLVGEYLAKCNDLLKLLNGAGIPTKQIDERHRELAKQMVLQIIAESRNAVEEAALTVMVATSLLATFDAQFDYIDLQLSMFEAEGGGCDAD